jgi:Ca-activated chloride channel family protein
MTRLLMSGALAMGLVTVLAASEPQPPVFRGSGDAVRVFVTVTDRDGRLVTALTRDAFEVRDEGKPQPITVFDNAPQPIRLIVMLDVSGSMEGNLPLLRDGTRQLVAHLAAQDVARVGTFGRDITISESFTRDARALGAALPDAIEPEAPTPLWRAIDQALAVFKKDEGEGRPVILVLSDGRDSGPSGPASFREPVASQAQIIDRARAADVMIYAVGMRSRGARQMQPGIGAGGLQAALTADLPDAGLARVAEETGGGYIEIRVGQDLGAAFAQVADELHSQYLIGFAPPSRDGKVHAIEVRVSQKGLKPRARKSYVAARAPASAP